MQSFSSDKEVTQQQILLELVKFRSEVMVRLDTIDQSIEKGSERFKEQELRIRSLEQDQATLPDLHKKVNDLEKKVDEVRKDTEKNSAIRKLVYSALGVGGSSGAIGVYHLVNNMSGQ